jgi:N-acetylmuramate 1-kinase
MTDAHIIGPRGTDRDAWLADHGLDQASVIALPSDASPRKYFRLDGTGLLLVQVAPHDPDQQTFTRVADHLNRLGLSAPATRAADPAAGFYLVEDFGHRTYSRELRSGGDETTLYASAVDAIAALHAAPNATAITLPPYAAAFLLSEAQIFADWFSPRVNPALDQSGFHAKFSALWQHALRPVADSRATLVLRDFHLDNLIHLPDRGGLRSCGLIDVQGALIGAPEYDLASLLQDARRDLAPGLEDAMLDRYAAARPNMNHAAFTARYHLLAAQRHTKIAGLFIRLAQRDDKTGYLGHLPRVLGHLETALRLAGLDEIRALLDSSLPDWQHGQSKA